MIEAAFPQREGGFFADFLALKSGRCKEIFAV